MSKKTLPPKISLKAARINAGLSQEQASEAIGISKFTLVNWEQDPSVIKVTMLPKIEEVYHYPTDFIRFR